jgi:hypothetical protein
MNLHELLHGQAARKRDGKEAIHGLKRSTSLGTACTIGGKEATDGGKFLFCVSSEIRHGKLR